MSVTGRPERLRFHDFKMLWRYPHAQAGCNPSVGTAILIVWASYKTPLTAWAFACGMSGITVRVVLLGTPKAAPLEPTL